MAAVGTLSSAGLTGGGLWMDSSDAGGGPWFVGMDLGMGIGPGSVAGAGLRMVVRTPRAGLGLVVPAPGAGL